MGTRSLTEVTISVTGMVVGSPLILGVAVLETSGLGLGLEEGVATRPVVTPRYDLCICRG